MLIELGSFQEHARQFLPLMVESAFETTAEPQNVTQQNRSAQFEEDVSATAEDEVNDFAQPLSDLPDSELPASLILSEDTLGDVQSTQSASDTLALEYPCICDNTGPFDSSSFPFPDEYVTSDLSQSSGLSQESLAVDDSLMVSIASSQDCPEIPNSTDHQGKGKARQDDSVASLPSRIICCYCWGGL